VKLFPLGLIIIVLASACSSVDDTASTPTTTVASGGEFDLPVGATQDFGTPPAVPSGAVSAAVADALNQSFGSILIDGTTTEDELDGVRAFAESGDVRLAWPVSDLLLLTRPSQFRTELLNAVEALTQVDSGDQDAFRDLMNRLIAWDIPAPPEYLEFKRSIYSLLLPAWEPLFADGSDVDWRHVTWGGVGIDARPFGATDDPCNCIPAADNPQFASAAETTWLDDDDVVFGVEINGESRAYPRQIMEVREMVNDTLGGRDIAMPYCTLCGSAQVYFTDELPDGIDRPIMRTSGLLIRSNKVMYELNTQSVFDTFTGEAVTGELAAKGLVLEQAGVVTTTWGQWRTAHPDTTALVSALALGRDFDFRNGRDANGPIFPVGDVDPRLPVQEDVVGVITESGAPIAFHLASAQAELAAGREVVVDNVQLVLDGGGVLAIDTSGNDLGSHQAFWFAWSQFYPETELWPADRSGNSP
jgi:hypothetical protein